MKLFQLTTSHRGRLQMATMHATRNVFQLTTSHRGRPPITSLSLLFSYFNSLPHTEVDQLQRLFYSVKIDFNSLPHTEVDNWACSSSYFCLYFNSLPLTEVDRSLPGKTSRQRTFQLTTSHRGRQVLTLTYSESMPISTHYLTQR